jgi:glycosyltransferase involved in cell wall biosynthesis
LGAVTTDIRAHFAPVRRDPVARGSHAPLSVLHVTQPTDGGVGSYVRSLVADQRRRGWTLTVACPAHSGLVAFVTEQGATHIPWNAVRSPDVRAVVETRALAGVLSRVGPDIVHLHSSKAGLAGRLAIRGALLTVFQPHGWSFYAVGGAQRKAAQGWERLAARWADALVCVSAAERAAGEAIRIQARYVVIPNGVDTDAVAPAGDGDRRWAREHLGISERPTVVCIGRLQRQKGQDLLLRAWPGVRAAVPAAQLFLIGDGPDRNLTAGLDADDVHVVGNSDAVLDWLAAADVVAIPSRSEGMSLVLLEAMARARSIVAFEVNGVREALGDSAGAIAPPEDIELLAAYVVERLRRPDIADREGRAARTRVERMFDIRRSTEGVAHVYSSLLARGVHPAPTRSHTRI